MSLQTVFRKMTSRLLAGMVLFLLAFFGGQQQLHAQAPGLYINEVSQGASGAKEYVELVVVGTPSCFSITTLDLRGWYIDDNNGFHATGAGTGIAQGCLRLTQDPLWSAVPIGTLIVLYNDADLNANIPAQDISLSDGNCRLVIPVSNCALIEKNISLPSAAVATYPTTGFSSCGSWTNVGMANSDDSFQTVDPSGNLFHSVSWGNNTLSPIIYFAGTSAGMVARMTNATSNNINLQANWSRVAVAGNESPGAPNNAANQAWICSMNNGCTVVNPLTLTSSQTNASCSCTGTALVTPAGGYNGCSGTYNYSWAPSGGNTATASSLCAGNYTVTVSDVNGCTATQTFAITSAAAFTLSTTQNNVNCFGGTNGSASVTVTGGTAPYMYAWLPSGGNSANATGLAAGTYTVTVTDAALCTATAVVSITQPTAVAIASSQTNANCNGSCDGSATVSASGGTGIYTYAWSPSGGTGATASSLCAGTYTCTITSAPGCTTTQSFSITQPSLLTASASVTNVSCNGGSNGAASVSVSGGTAAYSYSWSSGGNASTTSGLAAGNYTCTITDAHGCVATAPVSITAPPALFITGFQTNILCNGASTGDITAVPSGGVSPYTYSWSNSATTPTISNLSAGSYTCTVTDANSCTLQQVFTLTQPNAITVSASSSPSTCNNANGTLSATASGGTGTFVYFWTPGNFSSANVSNVAAGNYAVTVTDQNGCTGTATVTVGNSGAPLLALVSSANVSCNGGSDGAAVMNGSGGTGTLVYSWSPSGGTNAGASNLSANTYTCTVTDVSGCFATQTVSITQPNAMAATLTTTNVSCNNGSDGSASLAVTGGTGAYSYAWSPAGGNNANANNLPAGNYTGTITDANGCTLLQNIAITQPPAITASISGTDASCFGMTNATAAVVANGGTGLLSYAWTPSGGNNANANNLAAGNYTCTITDANGCTQTQSLALTQPPAISITTTSTDAHCNLSDGSAIASANGGTGSFSYSWLPSGSGATISNIAAGSYTTIVTDQNGCSDSAVVAINTLPGVNASLATATNISCFGASDGSISINAVNGNPAYTYSWTPNVSTSSVANALPAGNYQVVVADADGCTSTVTVNLVQPAQLLAGLTTVAQSICPGQSLQLTATPSGGTAAYSVTWNPGNLPGNPVITPAAAAMYSVTVTDAHGCTANDSVQIGIYPAPLAQFTSNVQQGCAPVCVDFADASSVNAPSMITTWSWDFGDGNTAPEQSPQHCYNTPGQYNVSLIVTTGDGCKDTMLLSPAVNIFAVPIAAFSWSPQPVTIFEPTVSFTDQSIGAASWQWSFGDVAHSSSILQDPSFTYPEPNCYTAELVVTSINGCTDTTLQEICVEPEVELYVPNAFTPNGDGRNDFFLPVGEGIDWNTFHMMIFDRWGNLIYETNDIGKPWDGRANGGADMAQTDVYVWKIDVRDINSGTHYLSGHVSLVR